MAFSFSKASNAQAIAEREWASDDAIMFTKFTSCIGLMGIKDSKVIAVHLSLRDTDNLVTDDDVDAAIALLDGAANPVVIGAISVWKKSVSDVYDHLVSELSPIKEYSLDDGIYGGSVNGDKVLPEFAEE
ncbi:MAG: hypothetical protein KTR23_02845 [Rhodospirillales bacterium]|nr:hypothetical protein [Rhodospirillales bacterium]